MKETHERSILAIVLAVQVLSHCTHEPTRSGDVLPEETEDEDTDTDLPVVSATCTTNGCLRWLYLYGDYPRSELESIIPSAIEIQNGYSVWYMGFMTAGHEAAATVTIPYGVTPPDEGWPVVLNNPGTVRSVEAPPAVVSPDSLAHVESSVPVLTIQVSARPGLTRTWSHK